LRDYENCIQIYQAERDELEKEFFESALQNAGSTLYIRRKLVNDSFKQADEAEIRWLEQIKTHNQQKTPGKWLYSKAWDRFNKHAHMSFY
ncbi:MAG: hypothetical protein ACE5HS_22195, partial [bacterium]